LTLSGSLTSGLLAATEGTRYGTLTRAEASGCSGGRVTALIEARAPWSLTYKSILGTLPNPTGLKLYINSANLLAEISGVASCLYEARLAWLIPLESFGSLRFSLRAGRFDEADQTFRLITTLSGICPTRPSIRGSLAFSPEQIVQFESLVQPGVLRLDPNPILIPKREGGNVNWRRRTVRVTNSAVEGSEDLIVVANSISFPIGDEFQVTATTCGGATLRARDMNECTITVEYLGLEDVTRLGTLTVGWIPVANTRINSSHINAATN
jgi:hypothetical protein